MVETAATIPGAGPSGFLEGDPLFPSSALRSEAYIQIAVRDPACVMSDASNDSRRTHNASAHRRVMAKLRSMNEAQREPPRDD